jgi:predicted MFS family arabinose efflux permease
MPGIGYSDQSALPPPGAVVSAPPSWTSWVGLCAASFFLAEENGVAMPFVNTYLVERGWGFDAIGAAAAIAGLIGFLANSPGGLLIDHTRHRRLLLAASSLLVGGCFALLPLRPDSRIWVFALLAAAALGKPLFGPLVNALTLGLVGHAGLNRAVGISEGWNHAGNLAAALTAMVLVSRFPVTSVFLAVTAVSVLAAGCVFLIQPGERDENRAPGLARPSAQPTVRFLDLIRDWRVATLLASATLFHLANAPVMPLVAQKIKYVGGSNGQVAGVVFMAQAVMIPAALLAGLLGERWGRKPILAVGFAVLPVRIALYALSDEATVLVALQALDGIGAGIFGVTAVAICGDLTRGRGHFNALMGVLATAGGLGGVVGPLAAGLLVQHLGFTAAFFAFAAVAVAAAILFIGWMPETRSEAEVKRAAVPVPECFEPEAV